MSEQSGAELIAAERQRQIDVEGWTEMSNEGEPYVRAVYHGEPSRVHCVRVGCFWRGDGADPEGEAHAHAVAHPGHTAVVEASYWIEFTRPVDASVSGG